MIRRLIIFCVVLALELLISFTVLRPDYGPTEGFSEAYSEWRANPTAESYARLEHLRADVPKLQNRHSAVRFMVLAMPTTIVFFILVLRARINSRPAHTIADKSS